VKGQALHGANQRQRNASAAAGVFDERAAGSETPVGPGGLDHGERHPVLHAAGRILALHLEKDAGSIGWNHLPQSDQRRVSDAVEDVVPQSAHDHLSGNGRTAHGTPARSRDVQMP